jgi:hypothetical protein
MTEKSKWELYKEKRQQELSQAAQNISIPQDPETKEARPWDLIHADQRADEQVANDRYSICLSCPELINMTKQCKKCGCFMALKTKVKHASCPIGKW